MEKKLFAGMDELPVEQYNNIELSLDEKKTAMHRAIKRKYTFYNPDIGHALTEAETAEAYRLGRREKQAEITAQEYSKRVFKEPVNLYPTADELYSKLLVWLKNKNGEVILDHGREEIYRQLSYYFSNDIRFKGELKRSLMLQGTVGTGKTAVMTFFQRNQNGHYNIVRSRTVSYEYKTDGVPAIEKYSMNNGDVGFCFDDLGTESMVGNYGDKLSVMAEVLLNRLDDGFKPSHITLNLKTEQIKEMYGIRLFDRIKQNYNQIVFPLEAKSLRK